MNNIEHHARRILLASIVAVVITVAACSSSADLPIEPLPQTTTAGVVATTTSSMSATTTVSPTTTVPSPEAKVVEVTTQDYAFVGLPSEIDAGTQIKLFNESTLELHEFVAIRLPDDETRSVEELVQLPEGELAAFFPRVESVILAPPGSNPFTAVGTGRLDKPGRYAIICTIPIGADPTEYLQAVAESEGKPDFEGGPPHFTAGMWGEVTVEG